MVTVIIFRPKYDWNLESQNSAYDFVGTDSGRRFGRVYMGFGEQVSGAWYWIMGRADLQSRFRNQVSGSAFTAREACRFVEEAYDRAKAEWRTET